MEEEEVIDTEEQVREVMASARSMEGMVIDIEPRALDMEEKAAVSHLVTAGCGCQKGMKSQPCSSQFSLDHVLSIRASCFELSRAELD